VAVTRYDSGMNQGLTLASVMDGLSFFASDLSDVYGSMKLRFILQILIGVVAATRDGLKDARECRPPYFWSVLAAHGHERRVLMQQESVAVGRAMAAGAVVDALYQLVVLRWIHLFELVGVVFVLVVMPYLIWRGPINRIATNWSMGKVRAR